MENMLERIIAMQYDRQRRTYGFDFANMSFEERIRYVRDQHQAAVMELCEALDEVRWKPWAKVTDGRPINRDAFVGELIDVLHFWLNMVFAVSGDATSTEIADEIFTRFALKSRTNAQRQVDGYDGRSTKCLGCGGALDDVAVLCSRRGDQGYCVKLDADLNYIEDGVVVNVRDERGAPGKLTLTPIKPTICSHCENVLAPDVIDCYAPTVERWGWCAVGRKQLPPIKIPTT